MIKYLIKNPKKWHELELFRFVHTFNTSFDKQIIDYLNTPTNEKAFMRSLSPSDRIFYDSLELSYYNDDNELLDSCYLDAEKSMTENTSLLISRVQKDLLNKDIFESLDELKTGCEVILEGAVIEKTDHFKKYRKELKRKIVGDYLIMISKILTDKLPLLSSELNVWAGRPGSGKTSLMLCVALEIARLGFLVDVISAEMPVERLIDRLVSYITGIPSKRITQGKLNEIEFNLVSDAVDKIENMENLRLHYSSNHSKIKRIISNSDSDLFMIDHLHRLSNQTSKHYGNTVEYLGEMTRDYKNLAVLKKSCVILLAQLSRLKNGQNPIPTMENLRGSGTIEEEANNITLVHRPSYYLTAHERKQLTHYELHLALLLHEKQRDGMVGQTECRFVNGRYFPKLEADNFEDIQDDITPQFDDLPTNDFDLTDIRNGDYVPY